MAAVYFGYFFFLVIGILFSRFRSRLPRFTLRELKARVAKLRAWFVANGLSFFNSSIAFRKSLLRDLPLLCSSTLHWLLPSFTILQITLYFCVLPAVGGVLQVRQQLGLLRIDVEFRIAGGRSPFDAVHFGYHRSTSLPPFGQDHWHTWTSSSHQLLPCVRRAGLYLHHILSSK